MRMGSSNYEVEQTLNQMLATYYILDSRARRGIPKMPVD